MLKPGVLAFLGLLFVLPVARAQNVGVTENPSWLFRPDAEMLSLFYPRAPFAQGVVGAVDLDCDVRVDQRVSCSVVRDSAQGWGFAEAAVAMSRSFRFRPATVDGRAVEGGRVRVPMRFSMGRQDNDAFGDLDLPLWEAAPTPDAVRELWNRPGRARAVLSCRVKKEDRSLRCEALRESVEGAGALALSLAPAFRVAAEEETFIASHQQDPFVLPINFGFGAALEPVNVAATGIGPLDLTAPAELTARFYPPSAAGVSGSATLLCTALREPAFSCEVTEESPGGAAFGAAAQQFASAYFRLLLLVAPDEWAFLEGDQVRLVVPFERDRR